MNKADIDLRIVNEANYFIDNKSTVRETASKFSLSKSTIHNDLSHKLKYLDKNLYTKVRDIMDENASVKHIRGGQVTKQLYSKR